MPQNVARGVQIAPVGSEKLCFPTFVFWSRPWPTMTDHFAQSRLSKTSPLPSKSDFRISLISKMAFARCVLANWTVREPPNCWPCRTNHKSSFSNQPGQPARPGQPACLSVSIVSTGVQKHEMVPNGLQMLVFIRLWEAASKHEMYEPAGRIPRRLQQPFRRPSAGQGQYPNDVVTGWSCAQSLSKLTASAARRPCPPRPVG